MEIRLEKGELLKLERPRRGTRLCCTGGTLWVTSQADGRDLILTRGQELVFDRQRDVLISAGAPSSLCLKRRSALPRLGASLKSYACSL